MIYLFCSKRIPNSLTTSSAIYLQLNFRNQFVNVATCLWCRKVCLCVWYYTGIASSSSVAERQCCYPPRERSPTRKPTQICKLKYFWLLLCKMLLQRAKFEFEFKIFHYLCIEFCNVCCFAAARIRLHRHHSLLGPRRHGPPTWLHMFFEKISIVRWIISIAGSDNQPLPQPTHYCNAHQREVGMSFSSTLHLVLATKVHSHRHCLHIIVPEVCAGWRRRWGWVQVTSILLPFSEQWTERFGTFFPLVLCFVNFPDVFRFVFLFIHVRSLCKNNRIDEKQEARFSRHYSPAKWSSVEFTRVELSWVRYVGGAVARGTTAVLALL